MSFIYKYLLLLVFFISLIQINGQTTIDFETAGSGYTPSTTTGSTTAFTDIFNRSNADLPGTTNETGYYWAVEDLPVTDPSITIDQIDITGSSDFIFEIDMLAHHFEDWDGTDELLITYSIDGGAYQNLLWVQHSGGSANKAASLDTDFDGDGDCGAGTLPSLTTGTSGCTTSSQQFQTFSSSTIALSNNLTLDIKLQFNKLNATNEGIYIDNIVITETTCISSHTVTSFAPTTGPELTQVTITGSGFTIATTAEINGSAVTSTYINATTMLVEIPVGYTNATIEIIEGGCPLSTSSSFTLIDQTGSCGTTFSDLIISEVYDAQSGTLGYIEIYNGTGSSINLSTYKIEKYHNLSTTTSTATYTFPASGIGSTISNGQVLVGKIGSGGSSSIYDFIFVNSSNGYNDDNRLELYDGANLIDDWHEADIGNVGYTYKRNTNITGPNTTYTTAEWTFTGTESTSDLGTYGVAAGSPPNITAQPNDKTGCTIEMDVTATPGNSGVLTYQWLFNDGAAAGWSNVTVGAFSPATVSGETTASLSITGTPVQVAAFDGYQFYCIVTEDGTCNKAARAAQFDARESSDPFLLSAMINACAPMTGGSCDNEGHNEFVFIQSGGVDVVVNSTNIVLKHENASPPTITYTDSFVADATAINNLNTANTTNGCGSSIFVDAVTTGTIPANSKIMLVSTNLCIDAYDFSNLCSQGPIYVLFSTDASWGSVGNFTNASATLRYFELSVTDINGKTTTNEFDYLPNSLSNNDGDYAEFSYCGGSAYSYSNDGCAPLKNILPVEFLNFTATKQKDIVRLDWTTASEINSDYFEVLKSTDGENFTIIETVKAAGNSSVNIDYLSYDYSPSSGNNYYSIHEVDFDNSITDTPVRIINFGKEATVFVSNSESRMLISYKDLSENSTLEIFTFEGKLIYYTNLIQPTGNIMFDAKKNQHYLVRIISNTSVQTIKYIH